MNKYIIVPALAVVMGGAVIFASSQVAAQGTSNFGHEAMVERLAEAFGKSEDEVESVMTQMHEERLAGMRNGSQVDLDEAVQNGELTEAQKQLILEKREELMAEHQARMDEWQSHHEEVEAWAEENGIDPMYLMGHGRKGMMGQHRGSW